MPAARGNETYGFACGHIIYGNLKCDDKVKVRNCGTFYMYFLYSIPKFGFQAFCLKLKSSIKQLKIESFYRVCVSCCVVFVFVLCCVVSCRVVSCCVVLCLCVCDCLSVCPSSSDSSETVDVISFKLGMVTNRLRYHMAVHHVVNYIDLA